jgi:hypothetical protein
LLSALFAWPLALRAADAPKAPKGFTALFNGKDLTGWHGMAHFDPAKLEKLPNDERKKHLAQWNDDARKHWQVKDGELVSDGKGAGLSTDRSFGDVELLLEYRLVPKARGAIYLRGCPGIKVSDGSGQDRDPLVLAGKAAGQWNQLRIIQVGERTTVHLNGKLVVDHVRMENVWDRKLPLRKTGPLQLQPDAGEVRFRNLFVRAIPSTEANTILRKHGSSGFKDVFNGKDFTGWAGPVDKYEVREGSIVCRPRKGGNIYTREEFADFVARVEYRLPPGGNNGLAIRYPGKGQASLVAMCEVQILDDGAEQYRNLDPRQYNGSAYGMVPAHRGYLRKVGEWNFMEVVVRGSTIQVELNGTRILDADLGKVTKFLGAKPHPGKDRTAGHFGFCGHNDPVAFRNIQIRRLERRDRK